MKAQKKMRKFVIVATFQLRQRSGDYGVERFTSVYSDTTEKKAMSKVNKWVKRSYGGYGHIKNIRIVDVYEITD